MKFFPLTLFCLSLIWTLSGAEFGNAVSGALSIAPVSREKFKLSRSAFNASTLAIDCRIQADSPVGGAVFIKDKDGNYFQSDRQWKFDGRGAWQTLRVPMDERNHHWRAFTNKEKWNARLASGIFEAGVSFWCDAPQKVVYELKNLRFEGRRRTEPLQVTHIQAPAEGVPGKLLAVKFQLTREYFNPFDPKEIKVACEWVAPDGRNVVFPAFYTNDFELEYRMTEEHARAVGAPYWELRYLPRTPGKHRFRILASDASGAKTESPWKELTVTAAPHRGIVQASKRNPAFFEFTDGTPFFPIGLNIHTNTDYRAESRLRLAPLADRGLRDYEDYFRQCAASGINCIEIWMASWTFALDWSSRRHNYYGVGRYNLANAAKLDRIFELAERHGILINLIFDNHGKFSISPTQEWHENPFNKESDYAESDGGFLTKHENFFANEAYKEHYRNRNRYLAARYGQNPNIFAIELWSEVDLVYNFKAAYEDKSCEKWHSKMIRDYQSHTPLRHLITTHVCGSVDNNTRYIRLWEIPEATHLAGDAYRNDRIPMYDQMRRQQDNIDFPKPCLITEFGGSSSGNDDGKMEADLHAGLWSAIFKKQAGLPFLWWHDFVILGGRLTHFRAVADFIAGIDFRNDYERRECRVVPSPEPLFRPFRMERPGETPGMPWERRFGAMTLIRENELIGWVFNNERLFRWRARDPDPASPRLFRDAVVHLPPEFQPGLWRIEFFDPVTGTVISTEQRELAGTLELPPFEEDVAFKLRRLP